MTIIRPAPITAAEPIPNLLAGPLTARTMETLAVFFADNDHWPSAEHMASLRETARVMEAMADGRCPERVYLAAIDCGLGKSQTTVHFARALAASDAHQGAGMVICVNRLAQVESIVRALDLPPGRLAVLTSDARLNALGTVLPNDAQVLVTTQQAVERRSHRGRFAEVATLHYQGQPRTVRVWDEAFSFGVPVTLRWTAIGSLADVAMTRSPALAGALHDFAGTVRGLEDGAEVPVPDFEADHGISLHELLADCAAGEGFSRDRQRDAVANLIALNGRIARAFRENDRGTVALSYRETIPDDLKPLLVLDASARVKQTYRDMERHRGAVMRLTEAVKDYADLTVNLWRTSGSKSSFKARGADLVKGVADTIMTKPAETWLVITHKPGAKVGDVEAEVRRCLPADVSSRVVCLTWGQHIATNDHSDVANVILAGQLFAPRSYYASLTHLSQGRDVADGLVGGEEIEATQRGELADAVLQAVARGRVRKSNGSKAQAMSAYIIASPRSGVPGRLASIFPGCRVVEWRPFRKRLRGHVKLAVDYLRDAFARGRTEIAYRELYEALEITKANFRTRVAKLDDFKQAVTEMAAEIVRGAKGSLWVRAVAD